MTPAVAQSGEGRGVVAAIEDYEAAREALDRAVATDDLQDLGQGRNHRERALVRALLEYRRATGQGFVDHGSLRYAANPVSKELMRWPYIGGRSPKRKAKRPKKRKGAKA